MNEMWVDVDEWKECLTICVDVFCYGACMQDGLPWLGQTQPR
jgi:hypothetical protein